MESHRALYLPFGKGRMKAMCEKCVELDGKIEHYQRLFSRITDQLTLDGIKKLIEQMQAQKAALHPEQSQ
jgi:FAD/FMN-containing dehydrogenase